MRSKIISTVTLLMGALMGAHSVYSKAITQSPIFVFDTASNVVFEQFSPQNFSLQLLQAKNNLTHRSVVVGGMAQVDLQSWHGDRLTTVTNQVYDHGNGLYFTSATLDGMANITNWGMAFVALSGTQIGQGGDDGNNYYFPHAFLLIGNLQQAPIYATIGINSLPFGTFVGSGTWDTPLTFNYFNVEQAPQLILSFNKADWTLNAGYFKDEANYEYHYVSSIFYINTQDTYSYGFNLGFLTNVKSNSTGNPNSSNRRKKNVAASNLGNVVDIGLTAGYKITSLSLEYLTGNNTLTHNSNYPSAYSMALSVAPVIKDRATTFGIARSVSLHLKNIPTTLPGQDAVPLVSSGLQSEWAASVSRPVLSDDIVLGLSAIKAVTYENRKTYAYTLDLTAFL